MKEIFLRPAKQLGIMIGITLLIYLVMVIVSGMYSNDTNIPTAADSTRYIPPELAGEQYIIDERSFYTQYFMLTVPFADAEVNSYQSSLVAGEEEMKFNEFLISDERGDAQIRLDIVESTAAEEAELLEIAVSFLPASRNVRGEPRVSEVEINGNGLRKISYDLCGDSKCESKGEAFTLYFIVVGEGKLLFIEGGEYETELLVSLKVADRVGE